LLLRAFDVSVRRLSQVAEVFSKDGVFNVDLAQEVKPGSGRVLEMKVRIEASQDLDVPFVELVWIDCPTTTDRFVAAAMPSRGRLHAQ